MEFYVKKVFIITSLIFLYGCSDAPSTSVIKNEIEQGLQESKFSNILEFQNIKKVNGFEESNKIYIADITYDIHFLKGLNEIKQESKGNSLMSSFGTMALSMQYGNFKAGDIQPQELKLTMIKTEQGWKIKSQGFK